MESQVHIGRAGDFAERPAYDARTQSSPLLVDRFESLLVKHIRLLTAALIGMYLAGFNGQWRLEPDSALFLSLGRNLAEGRGYTYLGHAHHLAYPGLPWVHAVLFLAFGERAVFVANVVMLLSALAALGLTYRLFRLHAGAASATVVMLGVGITKTFYRYAYELRSDMPFLVGVLAFLCGFEAIFPLSDPRDTDHETGKRARWFDWGLLVGGLGLAAVMRPTVWALLVAIVGSVIYAVARGRMRWQALLLAGAAIAVGIAVFATWDKATSNGAGYEWYVVYSITHHFPEAVKVLPEHLKELLSWATADAVFQVRLGFGNVILSTALIALGVGLLRRRVLWGLFFIATVLMILVILPLDRYYLPVIPLMVFAWWQAVRWVNKSLANTAGHFIAAALLVLGMASNLDKIGGIILEQRWVPFLARYENGAYQPLLKLAKEIHDNVDDNSLVLITHPYGRIIMFLSRRDVIDFHHFDEVNLEARKVYVIEPADAQTDDLLKQHGLRADDIVATVPDRTGGGEWTLHATSPGRR